MEAVKLKIKEVLLNVESYEWSDSLFLPDSEEWTLETKGIIWDPDDVECDEDEVPKIAEKNGLFCGLDITTIQEIVDNARQQNVNCDAEYLFEAFLYYWNNDAFISFNKE